MEAETDRWYHSSIDEYGRLTAVFKTPRSGTVPMDKVDELDRVVKAKFPAAELTKVWKSVFVPKPDFETWTVVWNQSMPKVLSGE